MPQTVSENENARMRAQAAEQARRFLREGREYRMGRNEAEQPHPLTRELSRQCCRSAAEGLSLLLQVDAGMADRAALLTASDGYAGFADAVRRTIRAGGRVVFSGCGSSGRLSMALERGWRSGVEKLAREHPDAAAALRARGEAVGNIMTGGDYAVIRAVESFEDSTELGREQLRQWGLGASDLLVGVTATGETTSILGTAAQALDDGVPVYMLICADPEPLRQTMARARAVYGREGCRVLTLPCGPMALTGSTRMQSSTFEQLAAGAALECALCDLAEDCGLAPERHPYAWYGRRFAELTASLRTERPLAALAELVLREQAVYAGGGLITMFADEFLLDILTDTTEQAPTFMTPPFRSLDMTRGEPSWIFVQDPGRDVQQAWTHCFLRPPRCIEWPRERYAALGFSPEQIGRITDVSAAALMRFPIGCRPLPERETSPGSLAVWVGRDAPPDCFAALAARYSNADALTLARLGLAVPGTGTDMMEHLAVKMMLNAVSTCVMARMGRIRGNWMTCLAMSNNKLIDRSARIVADLCAIPYEQALEENFYSYAWLERQDRRGSPVEETLLRLEEKGGERPWS